MARPFFLVSCLATALAVSCCHCHELIQHAASLPQSLSTSSRWIVDEHGQLACVNWPSHLEPMLAEGLSHRPLDAIAADVAAMGFNCVRLTWPTFLATDASYSSLTVAESLRALNLTGALAGVAANNPGVLELGLLDAFAAVVRGLGASGVMVVLDNHVSRPGWCCRGGDGNGFFGDAEFDPDVWVEGLTRMATMFTGEGNVVAMSLRNELRGARHNIDDWYRIQTALPKRGVQVHAAPRVLIILSGLYNDNDLSFLRWRPIDLTFSNKVAFEVHWYSFSDPHQWTSANANHVCARVAASVWRRTLYLLDCGWPVFLSEFGVDNRGGNVADNRYWGCVSATAAGLDLDWALWALQGSYYLREGVPGHDEAYGVLGHDWLAPRNVTALQRVRALQRPSRGPGLADVEPYKVLFHPVTGLCVVRRRSSSMMPLDMEEQLELGPCNETEAWEYNEEHRLVLRDSWVRMCLRADGDGEPVRLGVGRAGCAGAQAR
ncbi:hypothetical protein HU200_001251 [Digitaria exilis]|uniref:Glycoside hydrolase family 5 domain-containing protein n=1 Tax=Digitaria exilis TaxID=1010633 RepID=A0A835FZ14_9POAL|nr:hypothetical protein HU200_001251 [Digitaria exilis]